MENNNTFDEKSLMNDILKELKGISKFFNTFDAIKVNGADSLEKLEKALQGIPEENVLAKALGESVDSARKFVEDAKAVRVKTFKKYESEYIKQAISEGKSVREYRNGWRVGCLEIDEKPEASKVRILYNGEVLIPWSPILSKEDFIVLEDKAMTTLKAEILEFNKMTEIFWEAYRQAFIHRAANDDFNIVPMMNFYREVRIALVREFFEGKNPNSKITKYIEFPKWAFLYNLDIYRSLITKVPENKRLSFQTGSQQEVSQNKGMIINGLNPNEEYKIMCYVLATKGVDKA